jgi:hypothetical protein
MPQQTAPAPSAPPSPPTDRDEQHED